MRVAVAQLGARRHYLVPSAFSKRGLLEKLFTDISCITGTVGLFQKLPRCLQSASVRRLVSRAPGGIPSAQITAFTVFGLEYKWRCRSATNESELAAAWLWGGRRFCDLILRHGLSEADAVYGFNSAALELLRGARETGRTAILDQTIVPRYVERRILEEERHRWRGWEPGSEESKHLDLYCERERQEWQSADLILCGSPFVKEGIAFCGGPEERCKVVPFGADATTFTAQHRPRHDGPLRVLTIGTVGLRKGSPYVVEAAKKTKNVATYRMVGPINVLPDAERELRRHIELIGPVPRSQVLDHYRWADVLLLPSLCEGSANATYEALASGLPVLCTSNTGSVVRNGVDGYILPAQDSSLAAERIATLREDTALLRKLSENAANALLQADSLSYSQRVVDVVARVHKGIDAGRQALRA